MQHTIAFIGGGNMAGSLIGGLIASGIEPGQLRVADPSAQQREKLEACWPVRTYADNAAACAGAEVVVLAIKPQIMRPVATALGGARSGVLYVSIAAGIRSGTLADWLGGDAAIVRAMPNTPALIGQGATGLFANAATTEEQRAAAQSLLSAVGVVTWVEDEDLLDAVTALSGSGPAYFFRLMECLQHAAVELGLSEASARELTIHTAAGAAGMVTASRESAATLREQVTSPGGTTEAAMNAFAEGDLDALVARAVRAAYDRSREMAAEFGAPPGE